MRLITILLIAMLCGCSDNRLHNAAKTNDVQLIEQLITEGAAINGEYLQWGTPLHIAAQHQNIEAMDALIKNGADINIKAGAHDFTPLHRTIGKPWDLKATFFSLRKVLTQTQEITRTEPLQTPSYSMLPAKSVKATLVY